MVTVGQLSAAQRMDGWMDGWMTRLTSVPAAVQRYTTSIVKVNVLFSKPV